MLEIAFNEAKRFDSPVITSEHFVLAALRQQDGYAFKILSQLNIPIDKIVTELEEYLAEPHQTGETTTLFEQQYKINLAAIRHLQLSTSEARKMNAHVIGSEHILLALIHDKRAMDSSILQHIKEEYLNGGDRKVASPNSKAPRRNTESTAPAEVIDLKGTVQEEVSEEGENPENEDAVPETPDSEEMAPEEIEAEE